MPFLEDISPQHETKRGPLWEAFAVLRDQVERMVALNLIWALQTLPGMAGLAFPTLPLGLRVALVAYSALAIIPATAVVFALVAQAASGEYIGVAAARDALRTLALPSLRVLSPLTSIMALLMWVALAAGEVGSLAVLARVLLLCGFVCAQSWGPLFIAHPERSAVALLRASVRCVWRAPIVTLLTSVAVLLALLLGCISVGGFCLMSGVLVAVLQTTLSRSRAALRW